MFLAVSPDTAMHTRFSRAMPQGPLLWRSMFFGPAPSPQSAASLAGRASELAYSDPLPGEVREPQAFLVEQEPGAVVQPHFHYVDQFQVVFAGSGALGRHPVGPIGVHFAAAHTGYGPIQPGPDGLAYYTFRASADETGAQFLPAARTRMRAVPRRNVVLETIAPSGDAALAGLVASTATSHLEEDDGLAVSVLRIAPSGAAAVDAGRGGGTSMLVTGGAIVAGGARYAKGSCLFAGATAGAVTLHAAAGGAEVLVMRYPRKAPTAG